MWRRSPPRSRRAGAAAAAPSTLIIPEATAGSATSHMPAVTRRARSESSRCRTPCSEETWDDGRLRAAAISASARTTTALNVAPRPAAVATVPISGPNSAPAIAAPSALPISAPRRSGGASATIHARPPAHEHAPPIALDEPREVEQHRVAEKPERERRAGEQREAGAHGRLRARARREHAAGHRPEQRAERIARGHHAGRELRQVQLVRERRAAAARSRRRTSCRRTRSRRSRAPGGALRPSPAVASLGP